MHKRYCTCPKCHRERTLRKVALGAGIPAIALFGLLVIYQGGFAGFLGNPSSTETSQEFNNVVDEDNTPASAAEQLEADQDRIQDNNIPSAESDENSEQPIEDTVTTTEPNFLSNVFAPKPTVDELRQYALERINSDRKDFGLSPVLLSSNDAAQVHAEDILNTKLISHWMTNGEKPYMTYSRYGGQGYVAQNLFVSGDSEFYNNCTSGFYLCEKIDPYDSIDRGEYIMIYEDEVCCDNGHRDNILDKHRTHVSLGIAYNDYFFVMVQNFENNYINFIAPITTDDMNIQLTGSIPTGMKFSGVNITYEPLPTSTTYEQNKNRGSYGAGQIIAGVAPQGAYYQGIETISATNWYERGSFIDIRFSLESIAEKDGVYTIVTWLKNDSGESVPVTNHAIFINQ